MRLERYLNPEQQKAAETIDGPVLILAGAGSGKTRALTYRVANMIDSGINPWNILAITFTNKAAGEMRERIDDLVGFGSEEIWVATFHSTCVRILRRHIDKLGYDSSFTIYDSDDSKSLIKSICKEQGIDTKQIKEKKILNVISGCKDELMGPEEYETLAGGDWEQLKIALAYKEYQRLLKKNNALDFDDLIVKCVELFKKCPDVLENYHRRFQYICVDEYQDTNSAQFELIRLLALGHGNLCVVGDDDQSIYKFRGANIRNILDFEKNYPNATVIKLEQNYRSTQTILNAANAVIANNKGRKNKSLWTDKGDGNKIHFRQLDNSREEAEFITDDIARKVRNRDATYKDFAILYRTNAQSRELEERLIYEGIPYQIVGGQNFYGRKEIKDILAYLKTIDNGRDDLSVKRIVNVPKRGIGETSVKKAQNFADNEGISLFEALCRAEEIPGIGKTAEKLISFTKTIRVFRTKIEGNYYEDLPELIDDVINETGYIDEIRESDDEEDKDRERNIDEFISKAAVYEQKYADENPEAEAGPTLTQFLEEVSLVADIDNVASDAEKVLLMTIHSAKGLEFPNVYLAGMEDGVFPGDASKYSESDEDIEEERRLAYVGITRAKEELTLTAAKARMMRGETQYNDISMFVKEIPEEYFDSKIPKKKKHDIDFDDDISDYSMSVMRSAPFGGVSRTVIKRPSVKIAPEKKPYGFADGLKGLTKGSDLSAGRIDYEVGDCVRHIKFGTGTVKEIEVKDGSTNVTVEFEKCGVRVLNALFAKLTKV